VITVLVTVFVEAPGREKPDRRYFVRHYDQLIWLRLLMVGDTLSLPGTGDFFVDTDVPVEKVRFHPSNGNVLIELRPDDDVLTEEDLSRSVYELLNLGFSATQSPDTVFDGVE
jgi:hypothetical protein